MPFRLCSRRSLSRGAPSRQFRLVGLRRFRDMGDAKPHRARKLPVVSRQDVAVAAVDQQHLNPLPEDLPDAEPVTPALDRGDDQRSDRERPRIVCAKRPLKCTGDADRGLDRILIMKVDFPRPRFRAPLELSISFRRAFKRS